MKKIIFLLVVLGCFFCRGSLINYDEIIKKLQAARTLQEIENIQQEHILNDDQKKIIFDTLINEYKIILESIVRPGLESIVNGSSVDSKILRGHNGAIRSVCFSADSKHAISSSDDTKIKIWDVVKQTEIKELNHAKEVPAAVYTRSGDIFSVSNDKSICVWRLPNSPDSPSAKDSPKVVTQEYKFNKVRSAALGKDNEDREFVVIALDKTISRWNIKNIENPEVIFIADAIIVALALSFDGNYLCAGLKNGNVYVKKIKDYEKEIRNKSETEKPICCKHNACVSCMAISTDGSFFVTGSLDRTVRLWSTNSCKYEVLFSDTKDGDSCISAIALSHDNRFVMVGSFDSKIRLLDLSNRQIRVLSGHNKTLRTLAFSGDGNYALTGSSDNNVILWSLSKSWLINDLSLTMLVIVLKLIHLESLDLISNDNNYNIFKVLNFSMQKCLEKFLNLKSFKKLPNYDEINILSDDKITNIIADYMTHYSKEKTEEITCRIL